MTNKVYMNGYNLVNDGKYEHALKLANSCLNFDKKASLSGRDTKAYCLFKMKKYDESFAILDKRLLFAPTDSFALLLKTFRLSLIGLHEEAIKSANKFIRVARNDPKSSKVYEAYSMKALVLYYAGKYMESIMYYKKSLKSKPLRKLIRNNAQKGIEMCNIGLGK